MVARASPGVAATAVGDPGVVRGVTGTEGALAGPVPAGLDAVTVKVYAVPLVRPLTVHVVVDVVQDCPPGCVRTMYTSIGNEPLSDGGNHVTVARALPGSADTSRGWPGGVKTGCGGLGVGVEAWGVNALLAADHAPVPMEFTWRTYTTYD